LESRQLWLTNISCFEDAEEFIYTVSLIAQRLSLSATMTEEFLSFVTQQNPSTFVSCFCRDADRKDLWQRYGRSGGYNIEFTEQDMWAMAAYQAGGNISYHRNPSPCIYDKNRQDALVENAMEEWKRNGHGISFDQVYHLATVFKRQCFCPEQETRFIVRLKDLSSVKTREVCKRTVKYWELPLRSFEGLLPIRTITMGPTQDPKKAARDLRHFLLECQLKDVNIKHSKVSYEDFAKGQLKESECHTQ
jgi:hypothetical protein